MVNKCFIFFLIVFCVACQTKSLDPDNYLKWVNDYKNGLIKTETIGKIKYTVAYRPAEYTLAKYLLSNDTSSGFINKTEKHHSFIIKIEPEDGQTQILTIGATQKQEPFQRINYYMNDAQNYIVLVESGDTLDVSNYHYERYYNLSPAQCLIAGFDQRKELGKEDLKLIVEDKVFNTGKIAFSFDHSLLGGIPKLNH